MPKAVKIDVCGMMTEVDNMFEDETTGKCKLMIVGLYMFQ